MRSRISAGLVMYRLRDGRLEVLLAHPGGPFFAWKDEGYWSIPKGEVESGEDYLAAARREFKEEIGVKVPKEAQFIELGSIQQKGGKVVHAWGVEREGPEPILCRSNKFELEWPPGSGKFETVPEVDRAEFFSLPEARRKVKETQIPLLDRLEARLKAKGAV